MILLFWASHHCYSMILAEPLKISKHIKNRTHTVLFDVHSKVYVVDVGSRAVEVPVVLVMVWASGVRVRVVVRVWLVRVVAKVNVSLRVEYSCSP